MIGLFLALAIAPLGGAPTQVETSASAPALVPLDPQRLAIAHQLVDIVLPPSQRQKMLEGVLNAMMQNMMTGMLNGSGLQQQLTEKPAVKAVFDRFIDRQRTLAIGDLTEGMPALVDAYAHAYARLYPFDEMVQIKAFLDTPTGAKFMQRAPSLMSDPDVAGWMRNVSAKGAARQGEEIKVFSAELKAAGFRSDDHGQ